MLRLVDEKIFSVGVMSSGRLSANLTSDVGWEEFPVYAENFASIFLGKIIGRNDSVDTRVWNIVFDREVLMLVYEDFPVMITLESKSEGGDAFIEALKGRMDARRSS